MKISQSKLTQIENLLSDNQKSRGSFKDIGESVFRRFETLMEGEYQHIAYGVMMYKEEKLLTKDKYKGYVPSELANAISSLARYQERNLSKALKDLDYGLGGLDSYELS